MPSAKAEKFLGFEGYWCESAMHVCLNIMRICIFKAILNPKIFEISAALI